LVFLVKLPVYGVHLWLPKAHVEAPVSGSMVLAGVLLKLGCYGFYRFSFFFPVYFFEFGGYMVSLGVIGGVIGCSLCLRQTDIKSFIAYSSICHMGFLLAGVYSYFESGFFGGIIIVVSHGFCSSCLFYISYVIFKRYYSRRLLVLKGTLFYFPLLGIFVFLFLVLNIGVPPRLSFFSEVFILVGVVGYTHFLLPILFFFILLGGMCMIYFFLLC